MQVTRNAVPGSPHTVLTHIYTAEGNPAVAYAASGATVPPIWK